MAKNASLHSAKKAKNDEFYTQLSDVAKELMHYKEHFKGKIVFCNCDDPTYSAFWKYFHLNFHELGLKKLISTHYDREKPTYKMEYDGIDHHSETQLPAQELDNDIEIGVKTPLQGNGDFRNQECIELLKECDIVVTNPPFSLFREYVAQLMEYGKKFLIIGRSDATGYTNFFPLVKDNKIWCGYGFNITMEFIMPDEYELKGNAYIDADGHKHGFVPGISWWTNLDHKRRHEELICWQRYYDDDGKPVPDAEKRWPHYANSPTIINVNKMKDIPCDYYGIMGVPTTGLGRINPDQFEIMGPSGDFIKPMEEVDPDGIWTPGGPAFYIKEGFDHNKHANIYKRLYVRILIRRKQGAQL